MKKLLGAIVSVISFAGCATSIYRQPASPPQCSTEPPAASLSINDRMQDGRIVGYCWHNSKCIEPIALSTPSDPIIARPGQAIRLKMNGSTKISFLQLTFARVEEQDVYLPDIATKTTDNDVSQSTVSAKVKSDYIFWRPRGTQIRDLPATSESQKLDLSLSSGTYALSTFSVWPRCGDVFHGFLLTVE